MDVPIDHVHLFSAIVALYVIAYQITICTDWSWIPMNKEDYEFPYKDQWNDPSSDS